MLIPENLKESVLATLAYFDIFNHPLKPEEIKEYLFRFNDNIRHINLYLKESPKIESKDGYYFFKSRKENLIKRYYSERFSKDLWRKAKRVRPLLSIIPYVRMAAVCNTLTFNCVDKKSDIDLFIITKKNRLFTSRLLITLVLHILRLRRHGSKIAKRFCLSFYISEQQLNIARIQLLPYDIYLAYWIKTLKPIVDQNIYKKFIENNKNWIKRYFETEINKQTQYLIKSKLINFLLKVIQKLLELPLDTKVGDLIEESLKKWQKKRAGKKQAKLGKEANIIIADHILKFHNVDRRKEVREEWKKKLQELKIAS